MTNCHLLQSVGASFQVGHRNEYDRMLAKTAEAAARTSRLAAREELACRPDDGLGL